MSVSTISFLGYYVMVVSRFLHWICLPGACDQIPQWTCVQIHTCETSQHETYSCIVHVHCWYIAAQQLLGLCWQVLLVFPPEEGLNPVLTSKHQPGWSYGLRF